jgi:hypothetical protein
MKFLGSALLLFFLFATTNSFAENVLSYPDRASAIVDHPEGIRVSMIKPLYRLDANSNGFSFGYANLPRHRIGWTTNLAYLQMGDDGNAAENLMRADLNFGFSFTDINIKAGMNASKFISGVRSSLDGAIGSQISVGYQLNKYFGADLALVEMNQDGLKSRVTESGAEMSLSGTF